MLLLLAAFQSPQAYDVYDTNNDVKEIVERPRPDKPDDTKNGIIPFTDWQFPDCNDVDKCLKSGLVIYPADPCFDGSARRMRALEAWADDTKWRITEHYRYQGVFGFERFVTDDHLAVDAMVIATWDNYLECRLWTTPDEDELEQEPKKREQIDAAAFITKYEDLDDCYECFGLAFNDWPENPLTCPFEQVCFPPFPETPVITYCLNGLSFSTLNIVLDNWGRDARDNIVNWINQQTHCTNQETVSLIAINAYQDIAWLTGNTQRLYTDCNVPTADPDPNHDEGQR